MEQPIHGNSKLYPRRSPVLGAVGLTYRPAEGSMVRDFENFVAVLFPQLLAIGLDDCLTDAEKEERAHSLVHKTMPEFYGPDFSEAALGQEAAIAELPKKP